MNREEYFQRENLEDFVDEELDINSISFHMFSHGYDCLAFEDNMAVYAQDGKNGGIVVQLNEDESLSMVISKFKQEPIKTSHPDGGVRRLLSIYEVRGGKGVSIRGNISNTSKISLIKYFALATDAEGSYDDKNYPAVRAEYNRYRRKLI